jgi:hypothetical protein
LNVFRYLSGTGIVKHRKTVPIISVEGITLATQAPGPVNIFPTHAIYISMDEGRVKEFKDESMRLLMSHGYRPRVVPRGSVRQLRGGIACVDLEEGGNIDSAVLMARGDAEELEPRLLCRIDYAVRGDIQGIPAGRRITNVHVTREGFLRKRFKALSWVVPLERESQPYYTLSAEGAPPDPGEVWERGPHQVLTGLLNGDAELLNGIKELVTRLGDIRMAFNVFSDVWGESLRVSGGFWVKIEELSTVYASPRYLKIVDGVFGHLRETRRQFGGLTF